MLVTVVLGLVPPFFEGIQVACPFPSSMRKPPVGAVAPVGSLGIWRRVRDGLQPSAHRLALTLVLMIKTETRPM